MSCTDKFILDIPCIVIYHEMWNNNDTACNDNHILKKLDFINGNVVSDYVTVNDSNFRSQTNMNVISACATTLEGNYIISSLNIYTLSVYVFDAKTC